MPAIHVIPADAQDREQVEALVATVREVTDETVELAFSDQGYTGDRLAVDAPLCGIRLEVLKLLEANHGFVWEPRRWVVERSFAWVARFRRLAKDYVRFPEVVPGLHFLAIATLMSHRLVFTVPQCPHQALGDGPFFAVKSNAASLISSASFSAFRPKTH